MSTLLMKSIIVEITHAVSREDIQILSCDSPREREIILMSHR